VPRTSVAAHDTGAREQIIEGARKVLAKRGYDRASIKEIGRAARVAPGLVHYYFKTKDDLLLAVCDRVADLEAERVAARLGAAHGVDAARAALEAMRESATSDPEWCRLSYELFALGLRNPKLRPALARSLAAGRDRIAKLVERTGDPTRTNATAFAAVLLACWGGLSLQATADDTFDAATAFRALDRLLGLSR
jgi:AcrR family transcriptional regulator